MRVHSRECFGRCQWDPSYFQRTAEGDVREVDRALAKIDEGMTLIGPEKFSKVGQAKPVLAKPSNETSENIILHYISVPSLLCFFFLIGC